MYIFGIKRDFECKSRRQINRQPTQTSDGESNFVIRVQDARYYVFYRKS